MSLLPQQKKSAGEITKLRESLGIPGQLPPGISPAVKPPVTGPEVPRDEVQLGHPMPSASIPLPVAPASAKPPKVIRSLRKSEQVPLSASPLPTPSPNSKIPSFRRSDEEIREQRRQEAIAAAAPAPHPKTLIAHPLLILPGYLAAIAGAVGFQFYALEIRLTGICVLVALLFAGFIFLKKTYSRHHAAFIAVMALLVIVFGTLHYFPQLRHGT